MKKLSFLLVTLLLAACNSSIDTPVEQMTTDQEISDNLTSIVSGDFIGDGTSIRLDLQLISSQTGQPITEIPKNDDYDKMVEWAYGENPTLKLVATNNESFPLLTIHQGPAFGLLQLKNEGDLDGDGGDEISVIIDHADYSNMNSCKIFSLKNKQWKMIAEFSIREGNIGEEDFTGYILKDKSGEISVYTIDEEAMDTYKPLREILQ